MALLSSRQAENMILHHLTLLAPTIRTSLGEISCLFRSNLQSGVELIRWKTKTQTKLPGWRTIQYPQLTWLGAATVVRRLQFRRQRLCLSYPLRAPASLLP